ncbi:YbaB/EbfC family nucleoid-associated protein [Streptosporangium canum]|uniref:YbaB/EbfC family nucleoid-associated protein n=1 Tax=Streptosporangium canum TaxID=324952 RepID=UPI0033BDB847
MTNFNPDHLRLESLEDLEEVVRQSEEALTRLGGVHSELAAVTGEGFGADGLARAVVDGVGRIQRITFEPRITRLDSHQMAEAATEAVRAAQEDAQRQNEELLRAATGGEPLTLDMDQARRRFEEIGEDLVRALRDLGDKA